MVVLADTQMFEKLLLKLLEGGGGEGIARIAQWINLYTSFSQLNIENTTPLLLLTACARMHICISSH